MFVAIRNAVRLSVVFAILIPILAATAQEPDLFRTTPTFDVGDGPAAIVSCDLNQMRGSGK